MISLAKSWCDKLAATPTMGVKVDFHFDSLDAVLHALSPMLNNWIDGDRPTFSVEKREPFTVNVSAHDGFTYSVEPTRISVVFQHTMRWKTVSGGAPVAEMLSHPLPYTELLLQVSRRLVDTTVLICKGTPRKVTRIGVVAAAAVSADDIPPGMARFVTYMGRPWKGLLEYYTFQTTAQLADDARWSDRCLHLVSKNEDDPDQLIRLSFDWQRSLKTSRAITPDSMRELAEEAEEAATRYFEDLAEGNLFDEKLIREAT
jgi:hypothetical protein